MLVPKINDNNKYVHKLEKGRNLRDSKLTTTESHNTRNKHDNSSSIGIKEDRNSKETQGFGKEVKRNKTLKNKSKREPMDPSPTEPTPSKNSIKSSSQSGGNKIPPVPDFDDSLCSMDYSAQDPPPSNTYNVRRNSYQNKSSAVANMGGMSNMSIMSSMSPNSPSNSGESITDDDLLAMKAMIGDIKKDPSLLYRLSSLPGNHAIGGVPGAGAAAPDSRGSGGGAPPSGTPPSNGVSSEKNIVGGKGRVKSFRSFGGDDDLTEVSSLGMLSSGEHNTQKQQKKYQQQMVMEKSQLMLKLQQKQFWGEVNDMTVDSIDEAADSDVNHSTALVTRPSERISHDAEIALRMQSLRAKRGVPSPSSQKSRMQDQKRQYTSHSPSHEQYYLQQHQNYPLPLKSETTRKSQVDTEEDSSGALVLYDGGEKQPSEEPNQLRRKSQTSQLAKTSSVERADAAMLAIAKEESKLQNDSNYMASVTASKYSKEVDKRNEGKPKAGAAKDRRPQSKQRSSSRASTSSRTSTDVSHGRTKEKNEKRKSEKHSKENRRASTAQPRREGSHRNEGYNQKHSHAEIEKLRRSKSVEPYGVGGGESDAMSISSKTHRRDSNRPRAQTGDNASYAGDASSHSEYYQPSSHLPNQLEPPQRQFEQKLSNGTLSVAMSDRDGNLNQGHEGKELFLVQKEDEQIYRSTPVAGRRVLLDNMEKHEQERNGSGSGLSEGGDTLGPMVSAMERRESEAVKAKKESKKRSQKKERHSSVERIERYERKLSSESREPSKIKENSMDDEGKISAIERKLEKTKLVEERVGRSAASLSGVPSSLDRKLSSDNRKHRRKNSAEMSLPSMRSVPAMSGRERGLWDDSALKSKTNRKKKQQNRGNGANSSGNDRDSAAGTTNLDHFLDQNAQNEGNYLNFKRLNSHEVDNESVSGRSVMSRLSQLPKRGKHKSLKRSGDDHSVISSHTSVVSYSEHPRVDSPKRSTTGSDSSGHNHPHYPPQRRKGSHLISRLSHFGAPTASRRSTLDIDEISSSLNASSDWERKTARSAGDSSDRPFSDRSFLSNDEMDNAMGFSKSERRHDHDLHNHLAMGDVPRVCDDKGRCIFHPHIRLQKQKLFGGWKILFKHCPDCAVEHMKRSQKELAKQQMRRKKRHKSNKDHKERRALEEQFVEKQVSEMEEEEKKEQVSSSRESEEKHQLVVESGGGENDMMVDEVEQSPLDSSSIALDETPKEVVDHKNLPSRDAEEWSNEGPKNGEADAIVAPTNNSSIVAYQHSSRPDPISDATVQDNHPEDAITSSNENGPSQDLTLFSPSVEEANKPKTKKVNGLPWSDYNGQSGRYTGEVNEKYLPHGRGEMVYDRGIISTGIWYNGVLDTEGPVTEEAYVPDRLSKYTVGDKGKDDDMAIESKIETAQAVGQIRVNDGAFVRRSDGSWTYAIVKERTEGENPTIKFKVNTRGSTKAFPMSQWGTYIRRIKRQRDAPPTKRPTLDEFLRGNKSNTGGSHSVAGNIMSGSGGDSHSVGSQRSLPMMPSGSMDNLTTGKMKIRTRSRSRSRGKRVTTLPLLFSSSMSVSEETEGNDDDDDGWETASGSGYRLRGIDP